MLDQNLPRTLLPFARALQTRRACSLLLSDAQQTAAGGPRLVAATPCSCAVTRRFPHEVVATPIADIIDEAPSSLWEAVDQGRPYRGRVRLQAPHASGSGGMEYEVELVPLHAGDGAGATHFAWLIGESRLSYHSAATLDPDLLLIYDDEGTIRYMTPSLERMLGARPLELYEQPVTELCPPHERNEIHRALLGFGRRGETADEDDDPSSERPLRMRARHLADQRWCTLELDLLRYSLPGNGQEEASELPAAGVVAAYVRDVTSQERRHAGDERGHLVALSHSSETEKRVASRELHDGLGQTITGAAFLAKTIADRLAEEQHPLLERACRVGRLLVDAIEAVRSVSVMFSPLLDRTLVEALPSLAEMVSSSCGVHCDAEIDAEAQQFPEAVGTQLYWIAHEAVMNAVRHANASHIHVRFQARPSCLLVEDDGQGLCATAVTGQGPVGLGLRIMQCRAEQIGWKVELACPPTGGTKVRCTVAPTKSQSINRPSAASPADSAEPSPSPSTSDAEQSSSHEVSTYSTDSHDMLG